MNNQPPRFWTYILTDWRHATLYTGMTNHLPYRLIEHFVGIHNGFSNKYHTFFLVWYEETKYVLNAIAREKEIKSWTRDKKVALIEMNNPLWHHLNKDFVGNWPPNEIQIAEMKEYRRHEDERISKQQRQNKNDN
ncbi:MAG: GIY-YIG nuclease family protein [Chitinophagaceae bacterium]